MKVNKRGIRKRCLDCGYVWRNGPFKCVKCGSVNIHVQV